MRFVSLMTASLLFLTVPVASYAFPEQSCGPEECQECHWLTRDEAKEMLGSLVEDVVEVNYSEVKGFYEVDVLKSGRKIPVYIDFSKYYLFTGKIIRLQTMENITDKRFVNLNKVDVSRIPLEDAIILGDPSARYKIIVFDDPECPFCRKLHQEIKEIIKNNKDTAFYIKMLPLKIHPTAYEKAKSILCSKSEQMLEDSLNGKDIPLPSCETDQIEKNRDLAGDLGISSVPTLVYPDGMVIPGFSKAEKIMQILKQSETDFPEKTAR